MSLLTLPQEIQAYIVSYFPPCDPCVMRFPNNKGCLCAVVPGYYFMSCSLMRSLALRIPSEFWEYVATRRGIPDEVLTTVGDGWSLHTYATLCCHPRWIRVPLNAKYENVKDATLTYQSNSLSWSMTNPLTTDDPHGWAFYRTSDEGIRMPCTMCVEAVTPCTNLVENLYFSAGITLSSDWEMFFSDIQPYTAYFQFRGQSFCEGSRNESFPIPSCSKAFISFDPQTNRLSLAVHQRNTVIYETIVTIAEMVDRWRQSGQNGIPSIKYFIALNGKGNIRVSWI
eukprot:PhF_6_TR30552/c0_g1_i1/m.44850